MTTLSQQLQFDYPGGAMTMSEVADSGWFTVETREEVTVAREAITAR